MDLEFDKEIDAILRKARSGISVSEAAGYHLDADAIAAFAENVVPDKTKLLYTAHLADCERCRKQLSFVMQMYSESEAATVSAPIAEPVIAVSMPWYQSLFKVPNLAVAMGALVLAFGGVLGYLALQQQRLADTATVSQVTESERSRSAPDVNVEGVVSNVAPLEALIATANPTAPAANAAANTAVVMPGALGRTDADGSKSDTSRDKNFQLDGAAGAPVPAEPITGSGESQIDVADSSISSQGAELMPKGVNLSSVLKANPAARAQAEPAEKKVFAEKQKEGSKDADDRAKKRKLESSAGIGSDAPPAAAKVSPPRVGPVQNQANQVNSNMPVTRAVGGKTFNNRDGAWYDSAYRNQATADFRRGTGEYKKLDGGLRSIADTLGGTVVIVWKSKAYRIQ